MKKEQQSQQKLTVKKLVVEQDQLGELEKMISSLPVFAKTVSESMLVSQSINNLLNWLNTKMVDAEVTEKEQ